MKLGNQTIINSHIISYEVDLQEKKGKLTNYKELYEEYDKTGIVLKHTYTPSTYNLLVTIITPHSTSFTHKTCLGEISESEADQIRIDKQIELDKLLQPQLINL